MGSLTGASVSPYAGSAAPSVVAFGDAPDGLAGSDPDRHHRPGSGSRRRISGPGRPTEGVRLCPPRDCPGCTQLWGRGRHGDVKHTIPDRRERVSYFDRG